MLAQLGVNWVTVKEDMYKIRLPDFIIRQILSQVIDNTSNWKNIREKMEGTKAQAVRLPGTSSLQNQKSAGTNPKTIILLGLVAALALINSITVMKSKLDEKILIKMKRQRSNGVLAVNNFSDQELEDIRNISQMLPTKMVKPAQVKPVIIDTGASVITT